MCGQKALEEVGAHEEYVTRVPRLLIVRKYRSAGGIEPTRSSHVERQIGCTLDEGGWQCRLGRFANRAVEDVPLPGVLLDCWRDWKGLISNSGIQKGVVRMRAGRTDAA